MTHRTPYRYPQNLGTEEKLLIALTGGAAHQNMRSVLENMFRAGGIHFVVGHDPGKATLIQIGYGLKLRDIFVFAHYAREAIELSF